MSAEGMQFLVSGKPVFKIDGQEVNSLGTGCFRMETMEHFARIQLVAELLGHTTLDMTRRYTHLGLDTKREALQGMLGKNPEFEKKVAD